MSIRRAGGGISVSMTHTVLIGALTTPLPRDAGDDVQILPAGTFRARDGRPAECAAWRLGAAQALPLMARLRHRGRDVLIDYEHQTLYAPENGRPAPASGWLDPAALSFDAEGGLRASAIRWTDAARARIDAEEYRYLSPVISYDGATGDVLDIAHIALTNTPAVDTEPLRAALSHLQSHQEIAHMKFSERLAALMLLRELKTPAELATKAGITEAAATAALAAQSAPDAAVTAALATALKVEPADLDPPAAPDAALRARLATAAGLAATATWTAVLATALGVAGEADEPALAAALTARRSSPPSPTGVDAATAALAALQAEVASLRASQHAGEVETLIRGALADGRLLDGMADWARQLGRDDPARLRDYLAAAQPIAALRGMQSGGTEPPGASQGRMTASQSAVARALGISDERWAQGVSS